MPSFKIIGLLVPEKKSFKGFTIYGQGCYHGHVTLTIYINFFRLHMKFGYNWPSGCLNMVDGVRRSMGKL